MRNKLVLGICCLCCVALVSAAYADTKQADPVLGAAKVSAVDKGVRLGAPTEISIDDLLPTLSKAAGEAPDGEPSRVDNTCFQATLLPCGTPYVRTITFALPYIEDAERQPGCVPSTTAYGNSEWFRFVATDVGVTIDTCTPATSNNPLIPDTAIELYSGTCPAANLTVVACNDDKCPGTLGCCLDSTYGADYSGLGSELEASGLTIGTTYYFQVGVIGWHSGTNYQYPMGNYVLTMDCQDPGVCTVTCPPDSSYENEFSPGAESQRINDGCLMPTYNDGLGNPPVVFAEILPDETVCGSSYQAFGTDPDRDTDWYRLWLPAGTYTIAMTVEAEFPPEFAIYQPAAGPDPCNGYAVLALDNDNLECDPGTIQVTGVPGGVYWLFVSTQQTAGGIETSNYVMTVNTTPNVPAASMIGACCYNDFLTATRLCVQTTKTDCENRIDGVFWGYGTTCANVTCAQCPGHTANQPDDICQNDGIWTDTTNFGCGGGSSQAVLTTWDEGDTVCGYGGTHIPSTLENLRDNDWWGIQINEPSVIIIDALAEFPGMLVVWEMGCNPTALCETFVPLDWTYLDPGVQTQWRTCVYGRYRTSDPNDPGNIYCASLPAGAPPQIQTFAITMRSSLRGAPRELPCGLPYVMTIDLDQCLPGACCWGAAGCEENIAYDACVTGGGTFGGENSACADMCCPCEGNETPENEPDCGDPTDTTNGGCWGSDPPYYFGSITNGEAICGTQTYFDHDWYTYVHPGGTLEWRITADFVARCLILYNPNNPGVCESTLYGWEYFTTPECAPESMIVNASADTYWLIIRSDDTDVTCGRIYQVYARSFINGACCLPGNECVETTQDDCLNACGVYLGDNTECIGTQTAPDNPCCDVVCTYNEGEANCSPPSLGDDLVNGGCNSPGPPYPFGTQLAQSGDSVCGSVAIFETSAGRTRDMDWYEYFHTTGDLVFCVDAEFPAIIWICYADCANLLCWSTALADDCDAGACMRISATNPDLIPNSSYYLIVAPDFDRANLFNCGLPYEARVYSEVTGACCLSDNTCERRTMTECADLGGTYYPGAQCDVTSPCCQFTCTDSENEPGCSFPPNPSTNGGCNDDPPQFGTQLATYNSQVCGSTGLIDNGDGTLSRDTDWYEYQHLAQGDIEFSVKAQFQPTIAIFKAGPAGLECAEAFGCVSIGDGNCNGDAAANTLTWQNADPGTYYLFVAPNWDNDVVICPTQYVATLGTAGPTWCKGDSNCSSGAPTFQDITFFVAALTSQASWEQYHVQQLGQMPQCPYTVNDINGGGVGFDDIQPFVNLLGAPCVPN